MTGGKWEKDGNFVPGSSSTGMTDKDYGGGQCEHIIPFIDMAFIIGLNNTGFGKRQQNFLIHLENLVLTKSLTRDGRPTVGHMYMLGLM